MSAQHVIVVGGGLAGLAAACELARHRMAVTVFEGSGRIGGRARSTGRDSTIRNLGPHTLHTRGPGTATLADGTIHSIEAIRNPDDFAHLDG